MDNIYFKNNCPTLGMNPNFTRSGYEINKKISDEMKAVGKNDNEFRKMLQWGNFKNWETDKKASRNVDSYDAIARLLKDEKLLKCDQVVHGDIETPDFDHKNFDSEWPFITENKNEFSPVCKLAKYGVCYDHEIFVPLKKKNKNI